MNSRFKDSNGAIKNPLSKRKTTSTEFLKAAHEAKEPIGFNAIRRGCMEGWVFTDLTDQTVPSQFVSYGNILVLAAHIGGKVLFCYNQTCQGREFYNDMGCAKVHTLAKEITRLTAKAEKVPTPLQTVQMRINPTADTPVDDDCDADDTPTTIADFSKLLTINLIARANTDLTDTKDTKSRRYIPAMVQKFLKPIPLSEVQYTGETCNIIAFWRYCHITNAIYLYAEIGTIELMVEKRFFMYLKYIEGGYAIFTGVTAIDEGLPQGKTLTWGSEDTFFTPICKEHYDLYQVMEQPQFQAGKRLDYPVFGLQQQNINDYQPQQIYTIQDMALIHARVLDSNGPTLTEESWYVTFVPQVLGKGYEESSEPLIMVHVTSYTSDSKVLLGDKSMDDLMGSVYVGCTLTFLGKTMGSIPELHFQATRSKQRVQLVSSPTPNMQKYVKKFQKPVMETIAAMDERHKQLSAQRLQVEQQQTPKAVKPRRTVINPSVSPAATLFSELSITSTTSASPGLSVPVSENSATTQLWSSLSTATVSEQPPEPIHAQSKPPVSERPPPQPIYDDDDADALSLLGVASQRSSQQRQAETRALTTKFRASNFFDSSSSEAEQGEQTKATTKRVPFTRAPDENAVAPEISLSRKRRRFIDDEAEVAQEDIEAEDYNETDDEEEDSDEFEQEEEEEDDDDNEEEEDDEEEENDDTATTSSAEDEGEDKHKNNHQDEVEEFIFVTSAK